MSYIDDCLSFMNEERKACRKEMWRILNLKSQNDEGQSIGGAKVDRFNKKGQTVLSFPHQFTKVRGEKKVEIYNDNKQKLGEAEVVSIDYLKHEVTLSMKDMSLQIGETVLIILSIEVAPLAIIGSLKKMVDEGTSELTENLMNKIPNITTFGEASKENMIKTVDLMSSEQNGILVVMGPPGAGKTTAAKAVVEHLLEQGKTMAITSNSHHAINNLLKEIEYDEFKGAKICSRENQGLEDHNQIKNISVRGKNIDGDISGYQLVAGTCFALARVQDKKFDYIIVDEASQLKMSFLLSISRIAKNIIVLGDPQQLQSISIIDETRGGESVLGFLMEGQKVINPEQGYFLNTTYRMEPEVASVISKVFYEGKLGWAKKGKGHIELIVSNHSHGQKMSQEEADEVLKIYKKLKKEGYSDDDFMIVTPYNAQAALIQSMIKGVKTGTADILQGGQRPIVICSLVSAGTKKESSAFSTNSNRLNVALSRSSSKAYLIASQGLIDSEHSSDEFKQIVKMIS